MVEPVTHEQLTKIMTTQTVAMEKFIGDKFIDHEKFEMEVKKGVDKRIDAREAEIKKINHTLEDDGPSSPGIKTLVDRMWQDHGSTINWLRVVGGSVVGKILFDIFTK